MRIPITFSWRLAAILCCATGGAASAQVPSASGASPQRVPTAEAIEPAPPPGQAQRNWLLAHLIVDQKLSGEQAQGLEQKLANLSDDRVDVIARVYQQKRGEQAAAAQAELTLARENLDQLRNYRDALANEVSAWRVYRQSQYLNLGAGSGGYGGYGYGGYGFWPGLGFGGYGAYGTGFGLGYPYAYGAGVYPGAFAAPFYGGFSIGYGGYPAPAYGLGLGVY